MQAIQQISWLPVLVSAVVAFLLGWLWYGLLFKNAWVAAAGHTPEQLEAMRKKGMAASMVGTFVANFVICAAFSILVAYLNLHVPMQGARLGVLLWIGFAATVSLVHNLYSTTKFSGFVIDASYYLVFFVVVGCILTAWK